VCTRYVGDEGAVFDHFPYHQSVLHHVVGQGESLPGWSEDLSECRSESELPATAREYLQFISDFVKVPIALIGVGPARDEVIWTDAGRALGSAAAAASV
jgi:adenylosuccinate synthase